MRLLRLSHRNTSAGQRRIVLPAIALTGLALILGLPTAASAAIPDAQTLDTISTGMTTATVDGIVDPEGESTTYQVQYDLASSVWCTSLGASGSPANTTPAVDLGFTDTGFHFVSVDLTTGLTVGTDYCAQLIATNGSGEQDGSQLQWTEGAPTADTFDTFSIDQTDATVEGNVNPSGQTTTYQVEYDLDTSDWCISEGASGSPSFTTTPITLGFTDGTFHDVSVDLSGLTEGTGYCAVVAATNVSGTAEGFLQVLWVQGAPAADTFDVISADQNDATVEGDVNPAGQTTSYQVQYDLATSDWCTSGGASGDPANTTTATTLGFTDGTFHDVSVGLSGLAPSTNYCAELVATNLDGTAQSFQQPWTQQAPPPPPPPPPPTKVTLTLSLLGNGAGTVTSSPAGIDCGSGASVCSASFSSGTKVTLTATPAAGSEFSAWFAGLNACRSPGVPTCTITLSQNQGAVAIFNALPPPPMGEVDVQLAGSGSGTVTSSPTGIDCGSTCAKDFTVGPSVTLTAKADPGSRFAGWSGGGCAGTGACTVKAQASGPLTVTARFNFIPPPHCTLKTTGSKVKLKGSKAGVLTLKAACEQNASFALTGKVTIKLKTGKKTKTSHVAQDGTGARHGRRHEAGADEAAEGGALEAQELRRGVGRLQVDREERDRVQRTDRPDQAPARRLTATTRRSARGPGAHAGAP